MPLVTLFSGGCAAWKSDTRPDESSNARVGREAQRVP